MFSLYLDFECLSIVEMKPFFLTDVATGKKDSESLGTPIK